MSSSLLRFPKTTEAPLAVAVSIHHPAGSLPDLREIAYLRRECVNLLTRIFSGATDIPSPLDVGCLLYRRLSPLIEEEPGDFIDSITLENDASTSMITQIDWEQWESQRQSA